MVRYDLDVERRVGRVAEGGDLLSHYTCFTRIEGSNPSLSAIGIS